MDTKTLAQFINAAAKAREESYSDKQHDGDIRCGYQLTCTEAAMSVAKDFNASSTDAGFVGAILYTAWNDVLHWAVYTESKTV